MIETATIIAITFVLNAIAMLFCVSCGISIEKGDDGQAKGSLFLAVIFLAIATFLRMMA